jgi:hypothetical protein
MPEGTTLPELVSRVEPDLPCREGHHFDSGILVFEGVITELGEVTELKATRVPTITPPCPQMVQTCLEAISKWRYRPATRLGKPVRTPLSVSITIHFV